MSGRVSRSAPSVSPRRADKSGVPVHDAQKSARRKQGKRRPWFVIGTVVLLLLIFLAILLSFLKLRKKKRSVLDDFAPWPARLITRFNDRSTSIHDLIPASLMAKILRASKIGGTGLEVLDFNDIDSMKLIAAKIQRDFGPRLKYFVQDYESEAEFGVIHDDAPSRTYHQANNLPADILRANARTLTAAMIEPRTIDQWHLQDIQCSWQESMGEGVIVAVMDTGCDFSHPDLEASAWVNSGEIPENGIDDDGNGYVDDAYGYNFGDRNADLTDNIGHGTHVASIVAGAGVSHVSGVAPKAKIMCLKVADADNNMYASYMFSAYEYALQMGAHIVVNAFSNTYWTPPQEAAGSKHAAQIEAYMDALRALDQAGVLLFAAAGNEQVDNDAIDAMAYPKNPTNLPLANTFAIGASDQNQDRWSEGNANPAAHVKGSNFGETKVDIGAPGARIVAAQAKSRGVMGHETRSGTSMAAPFAAGVAALLLSRLAKQDYKMFGRVSEMQDLLRQSAVTSKIMGMSGSTLWGRTEWGLPNGVMDLSNLCRALKRMSGTAAAVKTIEALQELAEVKEEVEREADATQGGPLETPQPGASPQLSAMDVIEDSEMAPIWSLGVKVGPFTDSGTTDSATRNAAAADFLFMSARAVHQGASVCMFASVAAAETPDHFVSDLAPSCTYENHVGSNMALGADLQALLQAHSWLQQALSHSSAVRVSTTITLVTEQLRLRLVCPGAGAMFRDGNALYRTPGSDNTAGSDEAAGVLFTRSEATEVALALVCVYASAPEMHLEVMDAGGAWAELPAAQMRTHVMHDPEIALRVARYTGSAASRSSVLVTGAGTLIKIQPCSAPEHDILPVWDDLTTSQIQIGSFPGLSVLPYLTPNITAPFLAEFSGTFMLPAEGTYDFVLRCTGSCRLAVFGRVLVESDQTTDYIDESAIVRMHVLSRGSMAFRVLLYHPFTSETVAVDLSATLVAADSDDPAGRKLLDSSATLSPPPASVLPPPASPSPDNALRVPPPGLSSAGATLPPPSASTSPGTPPPAALEIPPPVAPPHTFPPAAGPPPPIVSQTGAQTNTPPALPPTVTPPPAIPPPGASEEVQGSFQTTANSAIMDVADPMLYCGSIHGVTVDIWTRGASMATSRPLVTHRLDASRVKLHFRLDHLFPNIIAGDLFAVKISGYVSVPDTHMRVIHTRGQATLVLANTLIHTSEVHESHAMPVLVRGSSKLPAGFQEHLLYRLEVELTHASHDELIQVVIGADSIAHTMRPLPIENARTVVPMRSRLSREGVIGPEGAFWMVYYPKETQFGVKIPNDLQEFEKHSWAISFHTPSSGVGMESPMSLNIANITDHMTRFSGFYRAKASGVHGFGLYCYQGDSIHVTLGGRMLVYYADCRPKLHDGIVFQIVPIYLPRGYYEFEYTLRTTSKTTYMMTAVLPQSPVMQRHGLIRATYGSLFLPASVTALVHNVDKYSGSISSGSNVNVVSLPEDYQGATDSLRTAPR